MPDTRQKALELNLDETSYGTFAEIGAGQEVARWFFRAGGAAGTLAETVSAYDKSVSDARYGPTKRYVSRERLQAMLERELGLLRERLDAVCGDRKCFFAFADTVATRRESAGDGWLGLRFQHRPGAEPSEVLLHAWLRDREPVRQQGALGVLGVNLIHGAFRLHQDVAALTAALRDDLDPARLEIDVLAFDGPAFPAVDNRLTSLTLVERGMADAALFTAEGTLVQPSEVLYKRPILVARGRFGPITNLGFDILARAAEQFTAEPAVAGEAPVILTELTLRSLTAAGAAAEPGGDPRDFLARADTLCGLGFGVLVSNFGRYFRLADYLAQYTTRPIGLAFGLPTLRQIIDGRYYGDLQGGVLEAVGRLFKNNVIVYVHPQRDPATGAVVALDDMPRTPVAWHLVAYLREAGRLQPIHTFTSEYLDIRGEDVRAKLLAGDPAWERLVPRPVAERIKRQGLFGYRPPAPA